jgi:hypothetical protein
MRRLLPMLMCLAVHALCISAQTEIPGGDITTTTWTIAGSPYNVNGNITIPAGEKLTIYAGVKVVFKGSNRLLVKGSLVAQGSQGHNILFTADSKWEGITISSASDQDSSLIQFATIEKSKSAGIVIMDFDKVKIANSIVRNNNGVWGGGISLSKSDATIVYNEIYNNRASYGTGICLQYSSSLVKGNIIRENYSSNYGGGIYIFASNALITNNLIVDNYAWVQGGGIYCTANTGLYENTITNNTIVKNGAGSGGGFYSKKSKDLFINNILWQNDGYEWNMDTYVPVFQYNAVVGGSGSGDNIFELDTLNIGESGPNFTDPENDDFSLLPTSPLLGAGTPRGNNIGHTGQIPDSYFIVKTIGSDDGGKASPSFALIHPDSLHTFAIVPNPHYVLTDAYYDGKDVMDELIEEDSMYSYTDSAVNNHKVLQVEFTPVNYPVTLSKEGNGIIDPFGLFTGNIETVRNVALLPDPGYDLADLLLDGISVKDKAIKSGTQYSYKLDSITDTTTLHAVFELGNFIVSLQVDQGGTVNPSKDSTVQYADTISYVIASDEYHYIKAVKLNGSNVTDSLCEQGGDTLLQVTKVDRDMVLEVDFGAYRYPVSVQAGTKGIILPNANLTASVEDETIFTILPDPGYTVDTFMVNNISQTDSLKGSTSGFIFTLDSVTGPTQIYVTFEIVNYSLTVLSNKGGTVTPSDTMATMHDEVVFSILPKAHYEIDTVRMNGQVVTNSLDSVANGYTLTLNNVLQNKLIEVIFKGIRYEVTLYNQWGKSIPSKNFSADIDDTVEIKLIPNKYFTLDSLVLDGKEITSESIEKNDTFSIFLDSITSDCTLEAFFEPIVYTLTIINQPGVTIKISNNDGQMENDGSIPVTAVVYYLLEVVTNEGAQIDSVVINSYNATEKGYGYYATVNQYIIDPFVVLGNDTVRVYASGDIIGINELNQQEIVLYPQPCREHLTIDVPQPFKLLDVAIFDITGKAVIDKGELRGNTLNVSQLNKGIYFIKINMEGLGERTMRFIKE